MSDKASVLFEKSMNIKLNEAVKLLFDEYCSLIKFSKGFTILMQGDRASNVYLMLQGIVRGYYIDEYGNDITKCFASENEFFSTEGLRTNGPSSFNIECMENCSCIQIPYKILKSAMEENADLLKLSSQYAFTAMEHLEDRARDLVMKSAEQRYRNFLEQFPKLEQRINQKYIASYIGIRESSLSRIKRQIINRELS